MSLSHVTASALSTWFASHYLQRPTHEDYFSAMATLVSSMSTCARARRGCVLVSSRNHVLATGYNGVPPGQTHCIESPCAGVGLPSGQGLELCEATHAEMNALLQCRDVHEVSAAYCTVSPCVTCVKLLLGSSCQTIFFGAKYADHDESARRWIAAGRKWQ